MSEAPVRRRGRPSAGVREAIVAATLELVLERGLARLSTAEIARRARVAEGSIYYHFGDKLGLLQAGVLAGLEPLFEFDVEAAAADPDRTLAEGLLELARALETFLTRALPILETIQSDRVLRDDFGRRLADEDLGPHRGVRLVEAYLAAVRRSGRVDPDADLAGAGALLVGACFLRAWQAHLVGPDRARGLPSLERTVAALASVLAPRAAAQRPA